LDRLLAHDADDCKQQAVNSLLKSKSTDEEINSALLMSVYGQFQNHDTSELIVERVQKKLMPAGKAAEAFMTVFAEQAKHNRFDIDSKKALIARELTQQVWFRC
jgi:hypothetical protein